MENKRIEELLYNRQRILVGVRLKDLPLDTTVNEDFGKLLLTR